MKLIVGAIICFAGITACSKQQDVEEVAVKEYTRIKQFSTPAPMAAREDYTAEYHGNTLSDPYHWLKDENYPDVNDERVLDYLKAENTYYDAFRSQNDTLINTLFEEFKGRVVEDESSVPWQENGYEYRWYFREGQEYRTYARKNLETGEETVFLDEPALAEAYDYFTLGGWDISPDNRYLAYSFNTDGAERYEVRIKDLTTGEYLTDTVNNASGAVLFGADNRTLVYGMLEQQKWRIASINAHVLGTDQADDKVLLAESDDGFFLGFSLTSDKKYLVLGSGQREISEYYYLPANDLSAEPTLFASRDEGFSYTVDHAGDSFYILANDTHANFRLASAKDDNAGYENWETLEAGSDNQYMTGFATFSSFMAIAKRVNGVDQITLRKYNGEEYNINFPEPVYSVSLGQNPSFDQTELRLNYQSLITPLTVYDYDTQTKSLITRKVKEIPSGYNKDDYVTERLMAPGRDGTLIPVSLVYKKGIVKDGSNPLFMTGYGAYGITYPLRYSLARHSLLDRGFIAAIAHVRGSDIMGYQWYLDGKLFKRTNTFNDFVDAARFLVNEKYTAEGNISIAGGSAGGELMGAVINQAPSMWRSVTLSVPFVDVLNTMLDENLPLTPPEWAEWGNPIEDAEAYEYMASYSPYDNIEAKAYPPMLVTGGLNDPRVTYWEPAKWTAKMRATKTDDNLLIMRMNMGAGHFANSGRYGRLKDAAEEHAFMLVAHGIHE